jgi:predicted metal-binding membrane protein
MRASLHTRAALVTLGTLAVLAWVALWLWDQSPYGRYLSHAQLAHLTFEASIGDVGRQASFYVAGWVLMVIAMMLPTTLPLIQIFARLTAARDDRRLLVTLLVIGYLAVWLLFGVVAHVADWGLHRLVDHVAWLVANEWVFGAAPLLLAGAFQFSSLKYRCLDKCRSPLSFVMGYWRGRAERRQALRLGMAHGVFCVGCCWALMLLMFAVGMGNLGWMLILAAVMATEKNLPWGRHLSAPLGIILIAWGALIVVNQAWSWQ